MAISRTSLLAVLLSVAALMLVPLIGGDLVLASSKTATYKASPNSDCALTYAAFEASIPHIDLRQCPGGETSDKVFCRAITGHDEIVLFKFSTEGDQCLLKTTSYDDEHFNMTIFDLVVTDE